MNSAVVTPPRMDPAFEVEQELQGTWIQVSGRWSCQLFFAAHHFAVRFQNGEVYLGVYTVDPTTTPPAMDMHIEQGPEQYRGQTARCVYELVGNTLRWCANEPGAEERHQGFPADGASKFPTLVFRRDGL
jgi:uncharacterized protein (TIGR03067 family)